MRLFIALSLTLSAPVMADVTPRCGSGGSSPSPIDYSDGSCDTEDTDSGCEDTGIEGQTRQSESSGIPTPVLGSVMASLLIVGFGALRRKDED